MEKVHLCIHARPPAAGPGEPVQIGGRNFQSLQLPVPRRDVAMQTSFEAASLRLADLPGMFVEADGAFVWASQRDAQPRWQVDGVLYDHQGQLLYVEFKGWCPSEQLDQLLAALGWPQSRFMFQLVQHAVFLDEVELRRMLYTEHH